MKFYRLYVISGILWSISSVGVWAQRSAVWREQPGSWLINVGVGTTRYLGDLNEWDNVAHLQLGAAINAAVAYRYSPKLTLRAEAQLYYIRGNQKYTHLAYNRLSFFSVNPDIWAGIQWDFWRVDDPNRVIIPYALAGVGLTYITPLTKFADKTINLTKYHTEGVAYNRLPVILRWGIGVPILSTSRIKFSGEATYTYVMSDYVDDVSTSYPDRTKMEAFAAVVSDRRLELGQTPNSTGAQRGNPNRRDGYFILSGRVIFVLMTPWQHNYRRMFSR